MSKKKGLQRMRKSEKLGEEGIFIKAVMSYETDSHFSSRFTSEIISTMFIAFHYLLCWGLLN